MIPLELNLSSKSLKYLDSLNEIQRKQILEKIEKLREDPKPQNSGYLKMQPGYRKLRIGDYRAIYKVTMLEIDIAARGQRGWIYE